ncbi:hypothetical protein DKX38_003037 [Salix brachista]|uniref:Kazal-like domain-containing protein n=1 Tax=Salix brachista TaxID=2182728 RepID=A0A5N5NNX9_9ROSI|nr:hypothetical protein DKX38_003037 [Salix brachista]
MSKLSAISTCIAFFLLSSLCFPIALSETGTGILIQEFTREDGKGDVCAGLKAPASCPVNCFRVDPVCGVDGVTYWCGCDDALCSGTRVAKLGACEVGSGGSSSLPGQALLLIHIVWLILLGFSLLFGFL